MVAMQNHRLRDDDPHRLRCPNGHSGWEAINGHFWCRACDRGRCWDSDGDFELVRDAKTGDRLDREDVRELEAALEEGENVAA